MSTLDFDYIVVGAGINGTWTALHLAKKGFSTLLLEQFPLPHSRGSSHGQTRIIRKAYAEPFLRAMMNDAFDQWRGLESQTNTNVLKMTGLVCFGPTGDAFVEGVIDTARKSQEKNFDVLHGSDIGRRFKQLRTDNDFKACFDYDSGVLFADKALLATRTLATQVGVKVLDNFPVKSVSSDGSVATVTGDATSFKAKAVVVCAGPWTSTILASVGLTLPLRPQKVPVYYFRARDSLSYCFIGNNKQVPEEVYGFPAGIEYPGLVKICAHAGVDADPDTRDTVDVSHLQRAVTDFIGMHFPGVDAKPSIVETCMYTLTPDHVHILDTHPVYTNIVYGCGFSGMGFKLAPVTGEILSALATRTQPKHCLRPFAAARFQAGAKL